MFSFRMFIIKVNLKLRRYSLSWLGMYYFDNITNGCVSTPGVKFINHIAFIIIIFAIIIAHSSEFSV